MPTEPHLSHQASNPEIQYEKTDAHARPLYQFLFWICVIAIVTAILSLLVLRGLESWRERASTRATMAQPQDIQQPPSPRLQLREPKDLAAFRREEAEILNNYGIVDREKGVYRIPIAEAMKLTLERGLLVAGEENAAPAAPAKPTGAAKPARPAKAKAARP